MGYFFNIQMMTMIIEIVKNLIMLKQNLLIE